MSGTYHNGVIDFREEPELKMGDDLKRLGFHLTKVYDYDRQMNFVRKSMTIDQGGGRMVFSEWESYVVNTETFGKNVKLTAEVSYDGYDWECEITEDYHNRSVTLRDYELKSANEIRIFGHKDYSDLREYEEYNG